MEFEYLVNASFSLEGVAWMPMNLPASVNMSWINDPTQAKDGSSFLRVQVTEGSGSVAQDVEPAPQAGDSYSLGLWLRAAPGSPARVPVQLTLWPLGGKQEVAASTVTTVGTDWTFVTVGLDVTSGGHSALRAELYVQQAGASVDMDGSRLCNANLVNASFSLEGVAWMPMNLPASVNMSWINDPTQAKDGSSFLRVLVDQAGGSVAQDVARAITLVDSYSLGLWLRAAPGSPARVPVQLTLWPLGGKQEVAASTVTTVGTDWTFVTVGLDILTDHYGLRAELYVQQAGASVDMDGSRLWQVGMSNVSPKFPGINDWRPENLPESVHASNIDDPPQAKDGSNFLRLFVDQAGGSVAQDITAPQDVICYSLGLWLRAAPGSPAHVQVRLTLWAWGGGPQEHDDTFTSVGTDWTFVTVGLDRVHGNQTVRVELYVLEANATVDVDGCWLVAGTNLVVGTGP